MLCLICKEKAATDHFSMFVHGKLRKLDLCADCSKANGLKNSDGVASSDLTALALAETEAGPQLKCSNCGFTQADFNKTGRLGCPACYETFSAQLQDMLKTMHKGTHHTGKVPSAATASRRRSLENALALAVIREQFEDAGRLRDELKQLPSL